MSKSRWPALMLVVCLPGLGHGQTAKPEVDEAAAAMQRAQRLASNPMRVILEASKIRRKGVVEPDSPPAEPVTARKAAPSAAPVAATAAVAAPVEPATPVRLVSPIAADHAALGAPALDASGLRVSTAALPRVAAAPAPSAVYAAPASRPQLLSMIEPTIPSRVFAELGRSPEASADLSIRADGTVAEVVIVAPTPRQLNRYVIAALEKWRFEPMAAPIVHRVQLVFSDP